MKISKIENEIIVAIEKKDNFTLIELFILVTKCERYESADNMFLYKVSIPSAIIEEINQLYNILVKFISANIVEDRANYKTDNYTVSFNNTDGTSNNTLNGNIMAWKTKRYFKTDDYQYWRFRFPCVILKSHIQTAEVK
jgi:hypothetical protein